MAPKIAIVYYSMYGHIRTLAEAEKKGIEAAGGEVTMYQLPETLPEDVLEKMHAKGLKSTEHAVLEDPKELLQYDAFLWGIPTRFGNFPAQWKTFIDKLGGIWQSGGYHGKYAGLFITNGTPGGGQESTALACMSTFAHHGIIYVPLGYKNTFAQMANMSEVHGGSPWGAGCITGADGSKMPSELELTIAEAQGKAFGETVVKAAS